MTASNRPLYPNKQTKSGDVRFLAELFRFAPKTGPSMCGPNRDASDPKATFERAFRSDHETQKEAERPGQFRLPNRVIHTLTSNFSPPDGLAVPTISFAFLILPSNCISTFFFLLPNTVRIFPC